MDLLTAENLLLRKRIAQLEAEVDSLLNQLVGELPKGLSPITFREFGGPYGDTVETLYI